VKTFLETWPSWLERRIVSQVPQDLQQLDPGEQEAIALAQSALKRLERTTFRTTPRLLRHIQEKLSP